MTEAGRGDLIRLFSKNANPSGEKTTPRGDLDIDLNSRGGLLKITTLLDIQEGIGDDVSPYAPVGDSYLRVGFREKAKAEFNQRILFLMQLQRQMRETFEGMIDRFKERIKEVDNILQKIAEKRKNLQDLRDTLSQNPELVLRGLREGNYTRLQESGFTEGEIRIVTALPEDERIHYIQGQIEVKDQDLAQRQEGAETYKADLAEWENILKEEMGRLDRGDFDGRLRHPRLREEAVRLQLDPDNLTEEGLHRLQVGLREKYFSQEILGQLNPGNLGEPQSPANSEGETGNINAIQPGSALSPDQYR